MTPERAPRWRRRLKAELAYRPQFDALTADEWTRLLRTRRVTSTNYDTVLALDWPHFCTHATEACGGYAGWCYTFQGRQASDLHHRHVAMVDALARSYPELFASTVASEIEDAVRRGLLPYPNLRYSGSGEVIAAHLSALRSILQRGVVLWGFTRNLALAVQLEAMGASVIVSCDATSPVAFVDEARRLGLPLAYSSASIEDRPPAGTIVTFPVHRVGRVREVVDDSTVCPKVLADFLDDARQPGSCQFVCQRCHDARGHADVR